MLTLVEAISEERTNQLGYMPLDHEYRISKDISIKLIPYRRDPSKANIFWNGRRVDVGQLLEMANPSEEELITELIEISSAVHTYAKKYPKNGNYPVCCEVNNDVSNYLNKRGFDAKCYSFFYKGTLELLEPNEIKQGTPLLSWFYSYANTQQSLFGAPKILYREAEKAYEESPILVSEIGRRPVKERDFFCQMEDIENLNEWLNNCSSRRIISATTHQAIIIRLADRNTYFFADYFYKQFGREGFKEDLVLDKWGTESPVSSMEKELELIDAHLQSVFDLVVASAREQEWMQSQVESEDTNYKLPDTIKIPSLRELAQFLVA